MMPCHIGTRAIDTDAAGERIVAFAPSGKHPESAALAPGKAGFRQAKNPDC